MNPNHENEPAISEKSRDSERTPCYPISQVLTFAPRLPDPESVPRGQSIHVPVVSSRDLGWGQPDPTPTVRVIHLTFAVGLFRVGSSVGFRRYWHTDADVRDGNGRKIASGDPKFVALIEAVRLCGACLYSPEQLVVEEVSLDGQSL